MNVPRVRVLFEHGPDGRPFGTSRLRLLLPLSHPYLRDFVTLEVGVDLGQGAVDAVIIDRRWHTDVTVALAQDLIGRIRRSDARAIYALDDCFGELDEGGKDWSPAGGVLEAIEYFVRNADAVLVTTEALRDYYAAQARHIEVLPNMLDERLLDPGSRYDWQSAASVALRGDAPVVIGYMGTHTHDDDLLMILPALRAMCARHEGTLTLELIGGVARSETMQALAGLPLQVRHPPSSEYAAFLHWFSREVRWDVALAPLQDTSFNRCKSDIKFLDYAAIGAAGVYSNAPAYAGSVRHRQTGLLVDNTTEAWTDALEELVRDAGLRRSIGANARANLFNQRTIARMHQRWARALHSLLDLEN